MKRLLLPTCQDDMVLGLLWVRVLCCCSRGNERAACKRQAPAAAPHWLNIHTTYNRLRLHSLHAQLTGLAAGKPSSLHIE